ncbi:two-component sensor histidine kinase [Robertmurraya siralis]|uniref:histidine kinase n=1 Tax=Robertmurraya siralis TaxID=77777 RepID=A0A919WFV6_9BACI|nr:HAMP domain-containing sensor histidine kinase [Robertmurraya siralis]PAE20164.1 sporulation kinase [Bacillus sp. 7504-2]GIN61213.1 two-component sensor histidine kinase [Robertmurraya siralis]
MLENVGYILYHVLIVIFPILLYYFLAILKNIYFSKAHKGILLALTFLILLLTISFPVSYANGFVYDLRIIPIIIAFIYIGFWQGIAAIFIMLLYLHFLGQTNLSITLLNYGIITVIFYLTKKKLRTFSFKKSLLYISALYWLITLTRSYSLIHNKQYDHLLTMFLFSIITWITLILVILLIETFKQHIKLHQELQRSEKLNIISQLAASVAHEVRNPMTTINGFLQLMKKDDNINEQQLAYINISLSELNRAQDIINDYLSLAKPNDKTIRIVNISEELLKTIELMTSYTNIQNIEVQSIIEPSLYIKGNADEIKQVFINIIKNGIEAMNNSGLLKIVAFTDDDYIIIKISDNGEGMSKEQLSRVGTPFYSTKDKGTGIGLTISFQIVEQLKGKITVESEVGFGTTFILSIPICKIDGNGHQAEHPLSANY